MTKHEVVVLILFRDEEKKKWGGLNVKINVFNYIKKGGMKEGKGK